VRPHRRVEIEHFFETYKLLEDKTVEVVGWRDVDRALEVLAEDRATWLREVADPGVPA
jgi:inorganic pyrophosphatase